MHKSPSLHTNSNLIDKVTSDSWSSQSYVIIALDLRKANPFWENIQNSIHLYFHKSILQISYYHVINWMFHMKKHVKVWMLFWKLFQPICNIKQNSNINNDSWLLKCCCCNWRIQQFTNYIWRKYFFTPYGL